MLKVVIDFLLGQKDAILKDPFPFIVIFVIGFGLGCFVISWSQKNRIETNEEIVKLLEQKLAYQGESKENDNSFSLNEYQMIALTKINEFEEKSLAEGSKRLHEYSVDNLVKDWQINRNEANQILKALRTLGLFESIWDNVTQFANLALPINETRPGRLTKKGREFLRNYRSGD